MKQKKRKYLSMQWLTSCVSTTLVLLLLGLVVVLGFAAHRLSESVKENLTVTLLLDDDLDTPQAKDFCKALSVKPYVRRATLISREQALKEEMKRMGTDPTEFLGGENPYTASIEMNVAASYAQTDSLRRIARELKGMWQVSDVVYQGDLVENLNSTLHKAIIVLAILAALLTVISIVLINNTVRLSVYARRWSIHTMRLVGASWFFIRRPFLRRSLSIGLTSATLANALLLAGIHWAVKQDAYIGTIITTDIMLTMVAAVYVCGLLLTLICTWLSVGHFLRMRENEMYR